MFKFLSILKFFKTRLGIIILCATATMFFAVLHKKPPPQNNQGSAQEPKSANGYFTIAKEQREQPITTINRNTSTVKTTVASNPRIFTETVLQNVNDSSKSNEGPTKLEKRFPIILNIYNKIMEPPKEEVIEEIIAKKKPKAPIPSKFAPFGRMIKCELVNTVDSGNLETPIIGLVMEPVYWNRELIIPASSEVHGIATTDKLRERIASGDKWNIILPSEGDRPNGMALQVTGVALDREDLNGTGRTYGVTDGSFGLQGYRIKSNNLEEIKLFASTFLGALTSGLQHQVPSGSILGGEKTDNTIRDASLGGITAVMNRVAERIEKEIDANGFYTRVPAGKQFYLYVQQNINLDDWNMAESLKHKEPSIKEADAWIETIPKLKEKLNGIES